MLNRRSPNNGGQRGLAFRDTCGFLTSDELKYWNENFFLDPDTESTLPVLHKRKETWNLNGLEIDARVRFFSSSSHLTTKHHRNGIENTVLVGLAM